MNILYINHPEADYAGYGLYHGLCDIFGASRVVDFPYKRSYHGEVHRYPNQYPSRYPADIAPGEPPDNSGITAPFEWAVTRAAPEYSEGDIRQHLAAGRYDLVFCEGPRTIALHWLRVFKAQLPPRIVLADGEDYEDVRFDLIDEFRAGVYLKRDLLPRFANVVHNGCSVYPSTFSTCVHERRPEQVRDIDIFYAVGATHPIRVQMRAIIDRLGAEGVHVDTNSYPWPEYINRIGRARISVAPRGFGQDTLRRWDIPAMGALMLAERLTLVENNPLVDGVHMVNYAPDASDFETKVRQWLGDEAARARVAHAGQNFIYAHHTAEGRAREALGWICARWPELASKAAG